MFVRNDRKVLLVALLGAVVATACGVSDRKVSVSDPEINGGAAGAEATKDDGGDSASGGRTSKGTAKSAGGAGGKATNTRTIPSSTGGMTTAIGGTATSATGSGGTAQQGGTNGTTGGTSSTVGTTGTVVNPCILDVSNLDACLLG